MFNSLFFNCRLQDIGTHQQNMQYLHKALNALKEMSGEMNLSHHNHEPEDKENLVDERPPRACNEKKYALSTDDLINCLTTTEVIDVLTKQMFSKVGISQTSNLPLPTNLDQDNGQLHETSNEWEIKERQSQKWKFNNDEKI